MYARYYIIRESFSPPSKKTKNTLLHFYTFTLLIYAIKVNKPFVC